MKSSYIDNEKEEIIMELLANKMVKTGQLISYAEFIKLYEPYKNKMSEQDFALTLDISITSYRRIKYSESKAKILKNNKENTLNESKEKIINELLASEKVQVGQSIDYLKFLELYNPYKAKLSEQEFATILDISKGSYNYIKYEGKNTSILNGRKKEETEKIKDKIVSELLDNKRIKYGRYINYVEFLIQYKPYEDKISERDFAELLGISYSSYVSAKYEKKNAKINDYKLKRKLDRIKYVLDEEKRYYTRIEIQELSDKYELGIEEIVQYILCNGKKEYISSYLKLLDERERIWIGREKCSKEFASIYSKNILQSTKNTSRKICLKYGCKYMEKDLMGDTIVYILENCGDIEKNYGYSNENKDIVNKILIGRIHLYIKYKYLDSIKKTKVYSIQTKYKVRDTEEFEEMQLKDKTVKVEDEVENKILKEVKPKNLEQECIRVLRRYVESGLGREEALRKTGEELGMDPEEMLTAMKNYMINKKIVKETEDGEYMVGD